MSLFCITLFIAQPLIRDHETGIAELFFSKPMHRGAYLLGRIGAGMLVSSAMFAAILALMHIGLQMPWIDAAKVGKLGTQPYVFSLGVIALPNLLFMAGLLALLASTTRSILMVYVGIVATLALWGGAQGLLGDGDNRALAAMLDPFGLSAMSDATRYWLAPELNTRTPALSGLLLANRLLWSGIGLVMGALAVVFFNTNRTGTAKAWWRNRRQQPSTTAVGSSAPPPARRRFTPVTGMAVATRQFVHLAWFDLTGVLKSAAFICFVMLGMMLYFANLQGNANFMGTAQYPVTSWALQIANQGMGLFLSIIVIFYAGELFHKERSAKMHEVTAACPTPDLLPLLAKCAAMLGAVATYMLALAATGIVFQLLHHYTHIEARLYAGGLALALLPYLSFALVALALQVLAQNKYVGYLLMVLLLCLRLASGSLGVEDNLLVFGSATPLQYSDLNGYGNNLLSHLAFQGYWLLFAASMLILASSTSVRGAALTWRVRLRQAAGVLRGVTGGALAVTVLALLCLGSWIFYNTHVLNTYRSTQSTLDLRQAYETQYASTANMAQPKITAVDVALDISPRARTLAYTANYQVHNPHSQPIDEVHLLVHRQLVLNESTLAFATVVRRDPRFGLLVLRLKVPLAPGASASWAMALSQRDNGFDNRGNANLVLDNGSFLHSYRLLPSFGFNREGIIKDPQERAKRHLPAMAPLAAQDDPAGRAMPFNAGIGVDQSDDADLITFNTIVSTDADQVALAPGVLLREWQANGRRYYQYKIDGKMDYYAAWLSGRWQVRRGQWNDVAIEVYHDAKHAYNVERMIEASRASLDYFSSAFSPYQAKQLRIVEFPRTVGQFAESFVGFVPYSESASFIADLRDPQGFDQVFYITAHEVAHQWWGHQIMPANVQGATMVGESLAQYSALMVVKKAYGKEHMRQFLKRELDTYLLGRGRDRMGEQPLARVGNQPHIFYSKGSLAFYRLAEEIGEDTLNRALKKFVAANAYRAAPYTTAGELLQLIRAEAGPQHEQLIADLFERITLYDNRVSDAHASKRPDGRYDVSFTIHAAKLYADAKGDESATPLDDWIEVAVFARVAGKEKALVLERRKLSRASETLRFTVDQMPSEVGIDPYNKLIDRRSEDNRMRPL